MQNCEEIRELSRRATAEAMKKEQEIAKYKSLMTADELHRGAAYIRKHLHGQDDSATLESLRSRLDGELAQYRKMFTDYELLVHLPIFGVVFHINDLGIIGGFSIFVLLLWMRASLEEELYGLDTTKNRILADYEKLQSEDMRARELDIDPKGLYELLSMQQFFFRPRPFGSKDRETTGAKALRFAVPGLICLPVIVEATLFYIDINSDPYLFLVNSGGYLATLVPSGAFLSANIILTYFAVAAANRQVVLWTEIAGEFISATKATANK
jgi:hypothetical protein